LGDDEMDAVSCGKLLKRGDGETRGATEDERERHWVIENLKRPRGLKPDFFQPSYAALEGQLFHGTVTVRVPQCKHGMVEFGFLMRARSGKQCFASKNLLVAGGVAPQTTSRFLNA
jgi:hypothetical protein